MFLFNVDEHVRQIDLLLEHAKCIPEFFTPLSPVVGIDVDIYHAELGLWKEMDDKTPPTIKQEKRYIETFSSTLRTLEEYLLDHWMEMDELSFIQYTDPASVERIMDEIGTKGVLNSPEYLMIIREESKTDLRLKKREWLVVNREHLCVISDEQAKEFFDYMISVELVYKSVREKMVNSPKLDIQIKDLTPFKTSYLRAMSYHKDKFTSPAYRRIESLLRQREKIGSL